MARDDRKRIAERLLRERLGLDEDWLNRDEDGTAHLPSALPRFLTQSLSRPALKALEQDLDQLVGAGCRRQALYFCLAQLNPEAGWSRTQLVATKQDMEAIANKAKAAPEADPEVSRRASAGSHRESARSSRWDVHHASRPG